MMTFLKHRISDPSLLRLIARFLKAGYMEEGKKYEVDKGTPQGGLCEALHNPPYAKKVIMQSKSIKAH